ncbi:MAG: hypothetical protein ACTHMS_09825 [Jatrophihabitans sp.]|uniref:hypothetical protein n=1 Tax=Jatrophihabitans sp. TaxID=1932789 RepID=UPI003F7E3F07
MPADDPTAAGRDGAPRPHRPARYADLTGFIDAAGGVSPSSRAEMAAATAEVVLQAGRSPGDGDTFVALADTVGIDTLAALWRDADPVSLPGVLWALYLLRQWCRSAPDEVVRLWRAGEHYGQADAAVAGMGHHADVDAVHRVADAILTGAYRGDFAVALERAAAFFRVIALGRQQTGVGVELAGGNQRAADALRAAAARWRAGTLH